MVLRITLIGDWDFFLFGFRAFLVRVAALFCSFPDKLWLVLWDCPSGQWHQNRDLSKINLTREFFEVFFAILFVSGDIMTKKLVH